jgi:hypothetical protein
MKTLCVRYEVSETAVAENERLVREVFDELRANQVDGVRYACFKQADGVSFVHIAQIDTADGSNPLAALPSFRAFQAGLRNRCTQPPLASELLPLDSYRLLE